MTHERLNQKGQRYNLDHFVDVERLNQKGQRYNLDHFVDGAKVHFYTAPSVLDVEKRTRWTEHIDH